MWIIVLPNHDTGPFCAVGTVVDPPAYPNRTTIKLHKSWGLASLLERQSPLLCLDNVTHDGHNWDEATLSFDKSDVGGPFVLDMGDEGTALIVFDIINRSIQLHASGLEDRLKLSPEETKVFYAHPTKEDLDRH